MLEVVDGVEDSQYLASGRNQGEHMLLEVQNDEIDAHLPQHSQQTYQKNVPHDLLVQKTEVQRRDESARKDENEEVEDHRDHIY